jgi:hypothetical protein
MKFRNANSTLGTGGSIPVDMNTHASSTKARGLKALLAVAMLSVALFALPGQAFAGDPCNDATQAQYSKGTQQCLGAGLGAGGGGQPAQKVAVPQASSGPSLPFTGLDVAALAAVALALTGTGMVLRRLATNGDSQT